VNLPPIGLGLAPLGKEADASPREAIDAAWDAGIRYFDTSPLYGGGRSELRAGHALAERPRAEYVISSKVGHDSDGTKRWIDHRRDTALRSVERSLDRLGTDRLDLVFVHAPEDHVDEAITGSYRACRELQEEGVVGTVGLAVNSTAEGRDFLGKSGAVDIVMLAGRFTLLDRSGSPLLDDCLAMGTPAIAAGVFNSGLLAGAGTYDYKPATDLLRHRADVLREVCARHDTELGSAAMQFPRRHPAVVTVLVGATTARDVIQDARWASASVPEAVWTELDRAFEDSRIA
jgi:D-threo-aldose 1-dehydrogenase